MAKKFLEVPAVDLRASIDPESLPFENTKSFDIMKEPVIGQERASDAIKFGMGMKTNGYHIYIAGPRKAGLTHIAMTHLEKQAKKEPTPPDMCYVYNFKEPDKPKNLKLSPGKGKELKKDMQEFINSLQKKILEVFESEDYRMKESEVRKTLENKRRKVIEELTRIVKADGFILQITQMGMVIIPAAKNGQPISREELTGLGEKDKQRLKDKSDELQEKMKEAIKKIQNAEAEFKEGHNKLDSEVALFVVSQLMKFYFEKYKNEAGVIEFFKMVQEDILDNLEDFKKKDEGQQQQIPQLPVPSGKNAFARYDINVMVDNSKTRGAPVVIESNPTYPNLFGTIERQAWFGALFTDFTMIKSGVLHKANGGYLVMKALDLLKWYLAWEALKRALRDQEIRIEDLGELYGIFSTRTIRPEPVPLDIKIVLTGDSYLFELLHLYDDRFHKLFKVKAHLDDRMERKEETTIQFAQMIGNFCSDHNIRHFDRTGVARILEYSMERTENQKKLTLELGDISDLLKEADYFAGIDKVEFIRVEHLEQAIQKRIFRSNLLQERIKELIEKDIFWIETDGYKTGQINGLAILTTGDYEFGKPSRVTANVSVGRKGVVAIEREAKMSGKIHTKGIMILTSFLKKHFAHNKPLSLTATLCFEQSYGMVEGDSASSVELFALLSEFANVPIYQGIAATGSISQKGEIQPVGGVTRKVESFFDICKHKGLNGRQGVIIPEKNIPNLMLRQEVVDSVKEGQFHVWPISRVEQGIEILTDIPAGTIQPDGTYPEGTLFQKIDERFMEIAKIIKKLGKAEEDEKDEPEHNAAGGH